MNNRMKSVAACAVVVVAMASALLSVGCVGKKCAVGANAPKVVSVSPTDGAMAVDPSLGEIVVCFDRPMQPGMSLTGKDWPKILAKPEFDTSKMKLTIKVQLKPATEYTLGLNSRSHLNFKSEDGAPLVPYSFTFKTKD